MFPYVPDFNPRNKKPAISMCEPHQLIVNSRQNFQNGKNGWCRFLPFKVIELYRYTLMTIFENIFLKIQSNILQMLCEKYENLICIIKWAVATYVKEKKLTRFVRLVLTGVHITNFFIFAIFDLLFLLSVHINI